MRYYPSGNEVRVRVYFTLRELTDTEEDNYFDGLGLPSGIGYDPHTAVVLYQPYEGEWVQLEGAAVVKDGVGAYHGIVIPEDTETGLWRSYGRGLNGEGRPVVTTPYTVFTVYH